MYFIQSMLKKEFRYDILALNSLIKEATKRKLLVEYSEIIEISKKSKQLKLDIDILPAVLKLDKTDKYKYLLDTSISASSANSTNNEDNFSNLLKMQDF